MSVVLSSAFYFSFLFIVVLLLYLPNRNYISRGHEISIISDVKLTAYHYVVLILIALIVAYRYNVGTDWESYKYYFEGKLYIGDFNINGKIEVGYQAINKIVAFLNGEYTFVFIIAAFIPWYFIFKSYPIQLLALGIFFLFTDEWFLLSTNLVRQFIAFGLFLYGLKLLSIKKTLQFLFIIFIAGLFHRSAWTLVLIALIPWQRSYNYRVWIIIYVTSFLFSQNDYLIDVFPKIFAFISGYLSVIDVYSNYFISKFYDVNNIGLNNLGVIFRGIIGFYIIYYSRDIVKKYPEMLIFYLVFLLGSVLTNFFVGILIISRFTFYLLITRPFLLALTVIYSFMSSKDIIYRIVSITVVLLYTFMYFYTTSLAPYDFTFLH